MAPRDDDGLLPFASLVRAMQPWPRGPVRVLYVIFGLPLLVVIKLYKAILSPLLPPSCRYSPSCSAYGYEAVSLYGPFKGGWLAATRIARCHPWHAGGFDPVPGSALAARFVKDDDGHVHDTHAHDDNHAHVQREG